MLSTAIYRFVAAGHGSAMTKAHRQPGLAEASDTPVATILREMGKNYATIAEVLGQKTEGMAKHYSRQADTSKKMAETVGDFDAEVNRRKNEKRPEDKK
ncbi:hypothetical protein G9X64_21430 [Rhizobium sophorae]|uniref:Uncharacterized protein n=1 Tax=Rhizobium sophorae TaxID=1535242 RepID=A0A7Y3WGL2_9HYPH|nr:hypothetical protein [Rhizobium sophorae]MBX4862728.1 hypothetical protein [Rhizobium bangladeshense]NNU38997.1 hypothetical protein [Rhizobium sophorae]